MKKEYIKPEVEFVQFDSNDSIMTLSGCGIHSNEGVVTPVCNPVNEKCTTNW